MFTRLCGVHLFLPPFPAHPPLSPSPCPSPSPSTTAPSLVSCLDRYAGISRLSKDYLNTTGIINKMPRLEGMAMFRLPNGTYYMAYVCMCLYMCVCLYVFVCVCMYVCVCPSEAHHSCIVSEALARETNKKGMRVTRSSTRCF